MLVPSPSRLRRFIGLVLGAATLFCSPAGAANDLMTKIFVGGDAVVRVTDAELVTAGNAIPAADLDRLELTRRGKPVPILLERLPSGSSDGRFAIRFVGHPPHGEKTWDDPYVSENVYVLKTLGPAEKPARIALAKPGQVLPHRRAETASPYKEHFEENRLLVRFTGSGVPDELWFWEEVKATDPAPRTVQVPVVDPSTEGVAKLRVRFVGYSHLPQNPDHTVKITWNGAPLGNAVWDGESPFVFEKELAASSLKPDGNVLSMHATGETTNGIDLVLLDWVELSYPRLHRMPASGQLPLLVTPGTVCRIDGAQGLVTIFDEADARAFSVRANAQGATFTSPVAGSTSPASSAAPTPLIAVSGGKSVGARVVVSRPADLKASGRGADYVVIAHPQFLEQAERLAAVRRSQGLQTAVVRVDDVYDRFRDGFLDPAAIRDFLQLAHTTWNPRPRYVLLLGDASWDYKNALVEDENYADWHWAASGLDTPPKIPSNVIGKKGLHNDRLRIPTWQYQSPWGHAASDNFFVAFGGADRAPDMAIGRLPVATDEEARTIVDKILAYERLSPAAVRGALFITNDEVGFQRQTDLLVDAAAKEGYDVQRVYPKAEEKDNAANTRVLEQAFDAGKAFVLFNGHGGRYIWRTGPPDLAKNHDLFTLTNLDELKPTTSLPVVVSLTCYSAPFDHPVADSIGEKLLRMPDKGAVAVVASSWRNAPPLELGRKLIELLGRPDAPRIGDAFLGAKKGIADTIALATYNLLGDPATPYRGPAPANPAQTATRR